MDKKYIIYKVLNKLEGKFYVGITTRSLKDRMNDHYSDASCYKGAEFQSALATHDPSNFEWTQEDTATSSNEASEKEVSTIFKYSSTNNVYNKDRGGGIKKRVYQYDIDTLNLVASYNTLSKAGRAVGASSTSISNACLGYNKSCRGYIWSYYHPLKDVPKDRRRKKVHQYTLSGEFIESFESASKAARVTGISKSCITKSCRGETTHCRKFHWRYEL